MTSRNETTDEFEMFNMIKQSGGHTYRGPEVRQDDRFEREVSQVHRERDEQQRSLGGNQFTYFAGPARNTFRRTSIRTVMESTLLQWWGLTRQLRSQGWPNRLFLPTP
jgi:hypothetical protein